jgi:RNA polymerase sigma-70 factor (ECF subfamily)
MENECNIEIKGIKINSKKTLDNAVVESAIKGSKEAFVSLIETYKEYLYRTAYLYVKNQHDASDIFQETVYKAFISIYKIKTPEYFKTWITKILINNINDKFRKNSKVVFMDIPEYSMNPKDTIDTASSIDLYNAIDNLKGKHKTAIILRYMQDMSIKDITKVMSCSENTVKSYIHRALKSLRINLKED